MTHREVAGAAVAPGLDALSPESDAPAPGAQFASGPIPAPASPVGSSVPGGGPSASDRAYGPTAGGVLALGSVGPLVSAVQQSLVAIGEGLVVDGVFGGKTQAAVTRFQATRGLAPDGVVGAATQRALSETVPAPASPAPAGSAPANDGPLGDYGLASWQSGTGDGPGGMKGTAPPPEIPSWYQHHSTAGGTGEIAAQIYFATDSDGTTPDDLAAIDQVMKEWGGELASGDWELDVVGFADQRADDEYNYDLAARRAGRVLDEMRLRGALPEDATFHSLGEQLSSMNPDDLAHNRRVEIHLRRRVREPYPLPEDDITRPKLPKDPGYETPKGWSTNWSFTYDGGGTAGLGFFTTEGGTVRITNLDTGETRRFTYAGAGLAASPAVGVSGPSAPIPFTTSRPVPIGCFASSENYHLGASVNGPVPGGGPVVGLDGWVLTGPRTYGADVAGIGSGGQMSQTGGSVGGTVGALF